VVLVHRLVVVQPEELPALLAAFATLFCMFFSYTILRPIRDTMGITSGVEKLPYLFWGTFVCMLAVQPVYGWLTSRFRRPVFLPWVYAFFTANLLAFYVWFNLQQDHTWIARTYYVWVSVFNFFIVAVFWSLMADVFTREQAGRIMTRMTSDVDQFESLVSSGLLSALVAFVTFAGVAVMGIQTWPHLVLIANSDPLVVALLLAAIDAHLGGHRRWAFAALVFASLDRPESWAFSGCYGVWLLWTDRRARPAGKMNEDAISAFGSLLHTASWARGSNMASIQ